METSSAAPPSPDDPADTPGPTPQERFVRDAVVPQRDELNQWKPGKTHTKLLLDSARRLKMTPKKMDWSTTKSFSLTYSGSASHGVYGTITTLVSHQAQRATSNRELTRQCLAMSGIDHLPSKTFHISQGSAAAAYADSLGRPVTIVPAVAKLRDHARTNISLIGDLAEAWEQLAQACEHLPVPKQLIEVEAFYPWISVRAFVVGESTVAAVARIPLFVVGDGAQSLGDLAELELQRRAGCSFLDTPNVSSAEELLASADLDPAAILDEGELRLLTDASEGQLGVGWSIDVTDQLSAELKTLAVTALWAFPGLGASGVDILTPSLDSADLALVTGLNPGADTREFRFPAYGKTRLPNRAIMEKIVQQSTDRR